MSGQRHQRDPVRPARHLVVPASVYADARGVDGLVNGTAAALGGLSGRWRRWQNGYVRSYALSMFAGTLVVVLMLLLVRSAELLVPGRPDLPAGRRRAAGAGRHVRGPEKTVKLIALVFSLAELAVVVALWMSYRAATTDAASQLVVPFRETFSVTWIPYFGINFSLGVDGISLTMIALIAVLIRSCWARLVGGEAAGRPDHRRYFALLLSCRARWWACSRPPTSSCST